VHTNPGRITPAVAARFNPNPWTLLRWIVDAEKAGTVAARFPRGEGASRRSMLRPWSRSCAATRDGHPARELTRAYNAESAVNIGSTGRAFCGRWRAGRDTSLKKGAFPALAWV